MSRSGDRNMALMDYQQVNYGPNGDHGYYSGLNGDAAGQLDDLYAVDPLSTSLTPEFTDPEYAQFVQSSSAYSTYNSSPPADHLIPPTPRSMAGSVHQKSNEQSRQISGSPDPGFEQSWQSQPDHQPYTPDSTYIQPQYTTLPTRVTHLATPTTPLSVHRMELQSERSIPRRPVPAPMQHQTAELGVSRYAEQPPQLALTRPPTLPMDSPDFQSPTITFQDYSTEDPNIHQRLQHRQHNPALEDENHLSVYQVDDASSATASTEESSVDFRPLPSGKRRASEGVEQEPRIDIASVPPQLRAIVTGEVASLNEPGNAADMAKVKREVKDWLSQQPDQLPQPPTTSQEVQAEEIHLRDRAKSYGDILRRPEDMGETDASQLHHTITAPAQPSFISRPLYPFIDRDRYIDAPPEERFQPVSSAAAMERLRQESLQFETLSRMATWGTRRMSDGDIQSLIGPKGLFRKLMISKKENDEPKPRKKRPSLTGLEEKMKHALPRRRSTKRRHSRRDSAASSQSPTSANESRASSRRSSLRRTISPVTAGHFFHHFSDPQVPTKGDFSPESATSPHHVHHGLLDKVTSIFRSNSRKHHQSDDGRISPRHVDAEGRSLSKVASHTSLARLRTSSVNASVSNLSSRHDMDEDDEDGSGGSSPLGLEEDREIVWNGDQATLPKALAEHMQALNPGLEQELVDRFSEQQLARFQALCILRESHDSLSSRGHCPNVRLCPLEGGQPVRYQARAGSQTPQEQTSDREVPNPYHTFMTLPTLAAPAEFECPLCFKPRRCIKPSDWTKHVQEDLQPFQCTFPECNKAQAFKRKADWVRHENETHRKLEEWHCDMEEACIEKPHTCYRKDNFLQHLVREHKMKEPKLRARRGESRPRDPEAQRTLEKLQSCYRPTQLKPEDEPCRFCGKRFDTWKKLTGHLASHQEQFAMPILRLVEQHFARMSDDQRQQQQPEDLPGSEFDVPVGGFGEFTLGSTGDIQQQAQQRHQARPAAPVQSMTYPQRQIHHPTKTIGLGLSGFLGNSIDPESGQMTGMTSIQSLSQLQQHQHQQQPFQTAPGPALIHSQGGGGGYAAVSGYAQADWQQQQAGHAWGGGGAAPRIVGSGPTSALATAGPATEAGHLGPIPRFPIGLASGGRGQSQYRAADAQALQGGHHIPASSQRIAGYGEGDTAYLERGPGDFYPATSSSLPSNYYQQGP